MEAIAADAKMMAFFPLIPQEDCYCNTGTEYSSRIVAYRLQYGLRE